MSDAILVRDAIESMKIHERLKVSTGTMFSPSTKVDRNMFISRFTAKSEIGVCGCIRVRA